MRRAALLVAILLAGGCATAPKPTPLPATCPAGTHGTPPSCKPDAPPADPHPICSVDVPRITECYHRPLKTWLYACPVVNGARASLNVEWGKEATCPKPPAPPAPPGLACVDPGENVEEVIGAPASMAAETDIAVAALALSRPDLLRNGFVVGWPVLPPNPTEADGRKQDLAARTVFEALVAELASKGVCAVAWKDALAVRDPGLFRWIEFHLIGHGNGKVGKANETFKHAFRLKAGQPPPPSSGACPVTEAMLDRWEPFRADLKPHVSSAGAGVDLTLWICGADVKQALDPGRTGAHSCLNFCCPVELDKGTGACDVLWGKARFEPEPGSDVRIQTTGNTNTVAITGGGLVSLCGSNVPRGFDQEAKRSCWTFAYPCMPDAADATKCQKNRR